MQWDAQEARGLRCCAKLYFRMFCIQCFLSSFAFLYRNLDLLCLTHRAPAPAPVLARTDYPGTRQPVTDWGRCMLRIEGTFLSETLEAGRRCTVSNSPRLIVRVLPRAKCCVRPASRCRSPFDRIGTLKLPQRPCTLILVSGSRRILRFAQSTNL